MSQLKSEMAGSAPWAVQQPEQRPHKGGKTLLDQKRWFPPNPHDHHWWFWDGKAQILDQKETQKTQIATYFDLCKKRKFLAHFRPKNVICDIL